MDLSWDSLKAAHVLLQRWRSKALIWQQDSKVDQVLAEKWITEVLADLQQDLDTPRALQKLRSLEKSEEVSDATKYQIFFKVDQILGLNLFKQIDQKVASSNQLQLLDKRAAARQQGDYEESDRLRELLQKQGIAVKDSKEGQSWEWII